MILIHDVPAVAEPCSFGIGVLIVKYAAMFAAFLPILLLASGCTLVPPPPEIVQSRLQVFETPIGVVNDVIPAEKRMEMDLSNKKVDQLKTIKSQTFTALLSPKDVSVLVDAGTHTDTGILLDQSRVYSNALKENLGAPLWSFTYGKGEVSIARGGGLSGTFKVLRINGQDAFEIEYQMDHAFNTKRKVSSSLFYRGLVGDKSLAFVTPITPSTPKGEENRALLIIFTVSRVKEQ